MQINYFYARNLWPLPHWRISWITFIYRDCDSCYKYIQSPVWCDWRIIPKAVLISLWSFHYPDSTLHQFDCVCQSFSQSEYLLRDGSVWAAFMLTCVSVVWPVSITWYVYWIGVFTYLVIGLLCCVSVAENCSKYMLQRLYS